MRILMITHEYLPTIGGVANLVYNIKKQLEAKGHQVDVFQPKKEIKSGRDSLKFWKDAVREMRFQEHHNDYDFYWLHSPLITSDLEGISTKIICTPHSTYNGRWEHQPIATYPSDIMKNCYYKYMTIKEKQAYKQMKNLRWFCASETLKKEIQGMGIEEVTVIPNGVDTEEYTVGKNKKEQICAVTRIVPWKRVDKLVDIFNKFKYPLYIAGEGPLFQKLETKAKPNVNFLGVLDKEQTIKLYQESKGFVSASDYEGFALAPMEAMSCGCVPLLSLIPCHEQLLDGIGDEQDPEKIHQFMKENYDWSIIVDKYLEALK